MSSDSIRILKDGLLIAVVYPISDQECDVEIHDKDCYVER